MIAADRSVILLVGDYDAAVESHQRAVAALGEAQRAEGVGSQPRIVWMPSSRIDSRDPLPDGVVGVWVLPGSPYDDNEAVLELVRTTIRRGVPLLATCAGMQYALVAFARASGATDATHAELGEIGRPVIERLAVPMHGTFAVDVIGGQGTSVAGANSLRAAEFRCSFGPLLANGFLAAVLASEKLEIVAIAAEGVIAAVRGSGYAYFLGTLFQPELSPGPDPVIVDFVRTIDNRQ